MLIQPQPLPKKKKKRSYEISQTQIRKRKTAHTLLSKAGIKTIIFHSSGDQSDE